MDIQRKTLTPKNLGIDNHHQAIIYTHADCIICRAEGFEVQSRIKVISAKIASSRHLTQSKTIF